MLPLRLFHLVRALLWAKAAPYWWFSVTAGDSTNLLNWRILTKSRALNRQPQMTLCISLWCRHNDNLPSQDTGTASTQNNWIQLKTNAQANLHNLSCSAAVDTVKHQTSAYRTTTDRLKNMTMHTIISTRFQNNSSVTPAVRQLYAKEEGMQDFSRWL